MTYFHMLKPIMQTVCITTLPVKKQQEETHISVNYVYHITYGPGEPEHSAGNRINALVQYRFLLPRFALITLLQTGHK